MFSIQKYINMTWLTHTFDNSRSNITYKTIHFMLKSVCVCGGGGSPAVPLRRSFGVFRTVACLDFVWTLVSSVSNSTTSPTIVTILFCSLTSWASISHLALCFGSQVQCNCGWLVRCRHWASRYYFLQFR